jgi:hypothetical protein
MAIVEDGVFCVLENGRSRPEVRDELIRLRRMSGRLVVGIDFAFGFPKWYADANGWRCGRDIWRAAHRDGESWLISGAAPFWGRTTKRPQHSGPALRRTEQAVGGSPRSIFQIGGAGAVGTGSIRGMCVLDELADAGFAVWPFEPAGEATIIEIYLRLFTGKVVESSVRAACSISTRSMQGTSCQIFSVAWRRQRRMRSTRPHRCWRWRGRGTRWAGCQMETMSTASRDASGRLPDAVQRREPSGRPGRSGDRPQAALRKRSQIRQSAVGGWVAPKEGSGETRLAHHFCDASSPR